MNSKRRAEAIIKVLWGRGSVEIHGVDVWFKDWWANVDDECKQEILEEIAGIITYGEPQDEN